VSVPNGGSKSIQVVASSYISATGESGLKGSVLTKGGVSTNPTGDAHTGLAVGDVVISFVGSGDNSFVPTARSGTSLYETDTGNYGFGAQYSIRTDTTDYTPSWTEATSDDWHLVSAVFEEVATSSVVLTGTVTDDTEADIVTGGSTIILTLTGDTFIAAGTGPIGTTANTQALIDGITSAGAEGTGWNAVVRAGIETTDVVRTSATVATITLDAEATYNITANETITVTIPAVVLTGGVAIVASPTFTITATVTDKIRDVISSGGGVVAFKR
jgi:hypothetical protein